MKNRHTQGWDLTTREEAVLHRLATGKVTKEIAEELKLSPKTVEFHRNEIYRRVTECHRNQQLLIVLAVRRGYGERRCTYCGEPIPTGTPYWSLHCPPPRNCKYYDWRRCHKEQHAATQKRCYDKHVEKRRAYARDRYHALKQAAAVALLLTWSVVGFSQAAPMPPIAKGVLLAIPYRTNLVYFAATAYDVVGVESPFSNECVFTNWQGGTNRFATSVSLAWNRSTDQSVTGYHVYAGGASHNYTNMWDAGNATNLTAALVPPVKPGTNVVTVTGTNLMSGPMMSGPWTRLQPTNGTSFSFTNPIDTKFFRGRGVKIRRVAI